MTVLYDKSVAIREMNRCGLHWFKFDETSGNVTDSKGSAVGALYGSPFRVIGWNGEGKAMSFDGVDDWIYTTQKVPLGKISIRLKIKTTQNASWTNGNSSLLSTCMGSGESGVLAVLFSNGRIGFHIAKGTANVMNITLESTIPINDSQWHDVLFTWDGTTNVNGAKLYIDNMSTPNATGTALVSQLGSTLSTGTLQLGDKRSSTASSPFNPFNGQIDEFEIYNDVIDPHFNKSLILHDGEYKKGKEVLSPKSSNLIEQLKFNDTDVVKGVKETIFNSPISPTRIYDSQEGYVVSFNGVNQYLRSTVNNLFPIGDKVIKYKVKTSSMKPQIVISTSESSKRGWFIGLSEIGTLHYAVNITGATNWNISAQNGKAMVCDNEWHEIMLEYKDGQYIRWYVDGELDYHLTHSYKESTTATNNLVIGCRASDSGVSTNNPFYFEGQFANLEIYKGELKEMVLWSTVSTTLPASQQFLDKGMDNLSPLLDRTVTTLEPMPMIDKSEILDNNDVGKVFSKTIDLKKYMDIRSVKVEPHI